MFTYDRKSQFATHPPAAVQVWQDPKMSGDKKQLLQSIPNLQRKKYCVLTDK